MIENFSKLTKEQLAAYALIILQHQNQLDATTRNAEIDAHVEGLSRKVSTGERMLLAAESADLRRNGKRTRTDAAEAAADAPPPVEEFTSSRGRSVRQKKFH